MPIYSRTYSHVFTRTHIHLSTDSHKHARAHKDTHTYTITHIMTHIHTQRRTKTHKMTCIDWHTNTLMTNTHNSPTIHTIHLHTLTHLITQTHTLTRNFVSLSILIEQTNSKYDTQESNTLWWKSSNFLTLNSYCTSLFFFAFHWVFYDSVYWFINEICMLLCIFTF